MKTIEYTGKSYRVFQGSETNQSATAGEKDDNAWYYEPSDYDGDALWSKGFVDIESACSAAYLASLNPEAT